MSKPNAKNVAREFEANSRHKLPPIYHSHRQAISRWLSAELKRVEDTMAKLKDAADRDPDDYIRSQLLYWRHGRSWVKTLAKINKQRRGFGNAK